MESRANYDAWRVSAASSLSLTPDKVFHVLETGKLAATIDLRERTKLKALYGAEQNVSDMLLAITKEINSDGYHAIYNSMEDNASKRAAFRKFNADRDGKGLLQWIDERWRANDPDRDEEAEIIKAERTTNSSRWA